jgi:hypothetical protein
LAHGLPGKAWSQTLQHRGLPVERDASVYLRSKMLG